MADLIHLPNLRHGYSMLINRILQQGRVVSPRGRSTLEIEDATFTIDDKLDTLPVGMGRKLNVHIGALEAAQLVGGVARSDLLCAVAPSFEDFNEPGKHEHYGAYGARIGTQLSDVLTKLRSDRHSRQAIIALWDKELDNKGGHKDYPCTLVLGFRLRNDCVNMSVTMRSNDVWLGTAYDVFQFTQLQLAIARILNAGVGTYTHTAWSLHIYEDDIERAQELFEPDEIVYRPLPNGVKPSYLRSLLYQLTNSKNLPQPSDEDEAWYYIRLKSAHEALERKQTKL